MSVLTGCLVKSIALVPLFMLFLALKKYLRNRIKASSRCAMWLILISSLIIPAGCFKIKVPDEMVRKSPVSYMIDSTDFDYNEADADYVVSDVSVFRKTTDMRYVVLSVWAGGVLLYSLFNGYTIIRFRHECGHLREKEYHGVVYYVSENVNSPMLLGILRKKIIVPDKLYDDKELIYVLRHEESHARHGDVFKKVFALCVNVIFWYNPCVWFMRRELSRDIEFACDERLTDNLNISERIAYSEALVHMVEKRHESSVVSFFSQKNSLKDRIRTIVDKPKLRRGVLFVLIEVLVVTFCTISIIPIKADVAVQLHEEQETAESVIYDNHKDCEMENPIWPVDMNNAYVSAKYGVRSEPECDKDNKSNMIHTGIDIAGKITETGNSLMGSSIYAVVSGNIVDTGYDNSYGRYITLGTEEGYLITYAHCNQIFVENKDVVNQGDIIATVGDSGKVIGPSLHLEVIRNNKYIDPERFLGGNK